MLWAQEANVVFRRDKARAFAVSDVWDLATDFVDAYLTHKVTAQVALKEVLFTSQATNTAASPAIGAVQHVSRVAVFDGAAIAAESTIFRLTVLAPVTLPILGNDALF